ncbi:hypothetical protein OGH69_06455 [Flavobacterium sp. MFBS3-15]|uniref:hypothetical protein n=1 Tax=Flavobacterium sp. MFBS3-15 TaxID=2989816 RepID=UPI0022366EAD|nr:hypothetical protein [Flavobacterium sp. MFBS3-15]MCW4468595.1 hypothetical protein [Flavobacterium sp. MFBS3-15]
MNTVLKIEKIFNPAFGGTLLIGTLEGEKDFFRKSKWLLRGSKGYNEIIAVKSEQIPEGAAAGKRIFVSDFFLDKSHLNDEELELEFIGYAE